MRSRINEIKIKTKILIFLFPFRINLFNLIKLNGKLFEYFSIKNQHHNKKKKLIFLKSLSPKLNFFMSGNN